MLKAICHWWLTTSAKPEVEVWNDILLTSPAITHRLQEILGSFSQEELLFLFDIEKLAAPNTPPGSVLKWAQPDVKVIDHLETKGVCQRARGRWQIGSRLLAAYLFQFAGRGQGRIWLDQKTEELYQGERLIDDLTPLERAVLQFLLHYPRLRHTKTDLIVNAWPDELRQMGVSDDSLYQVVAGLRKKIEPMPTKPCYILNWRGKPEGGYQLFPEGRPL